MCCWELWKVYLFHEQERFYKTKKKLGYTTGYLFRLTGSKRPIPDSIVTLVDNRWDKNSGSEAQIVEM